MAEVGKIIFAVVVAELVLKGIKNFNFWSKPAVAPVKEKLPGKDLATAPLGDVMCVIEVLKKRKDMGKFLKDDVDPKLFKEIGWEQVRLVFKLNDQYVIPFEQMYDSKFHVAAFETAWARTEDVECEDAVYRILSSIGCDNMFSRSRIVLETTSVGSYSFIYNFFIELTPEEYVNITKKKLYLVIKQDTAERMGSAGLLTCMGKHIHIREDTLNFIKTQEI